MCCVLPRTDAAHTNTVHILCLDVANVVVRSIHKKTLPELELQQEWNAKFASLAAAHPSFNPALLCILVSSKALAAPLHTPFTNSPDHMCKGTLRTPPRQRVLECLQPLETARS